MVYAYKAVQPITETETEIVGKVDEVEKVEEVEKTPADSTIAAQDTTAFIIKVKTIAEEETSPTEESDGSRIISFEALRARTQEPVDVEVTLFDPYFEKVITTMRSCESKIVSPPDNNQDLIRVRTNTFGWKTDAVSFYLNDPLSDSTNYFVKVSNDTLILFFDMHRLRKGDVQILFNVYFQSESAFMRPVSKLQLQELWDMLDENPKYRIKLHGHTNCNASGEYTRLGENDTIFFQTSSKHELTSGSAKKLSADRALTVKKYLIARGITQSNRY